MFLEEKTGHYFACFALLSIHFHSQIHFKKGNSKDSFVYYFCSEMGVLLARKWKLYAPLVPGVYVAPRKAQFFLAPVAQQLYGCFMFAIWILYFEIELF